MTDQSFISQYLQDVIKTFRAYKRLAERAVEQVSDEELFRSIDTESNSIAVIMKHLAGNSISRWTDFLTADGEKPTRNRDLEFVVDEETTRESLHAYWDHGWSALFTAIEPLTDADFAKTITIRGEPHSVLEAINRQLTHYSYHVGQIVFLAKHLRGEGWQTLSVPKNKSAQFNKFLEQKLQRGEKLDHRMEMAESFAEELKKKDSN